MSDTIPRVFNRALPNGVSYDLSTHGHVKITLPQGSSWSSGLHWHETHTEYLKLVQGSVRVRLGDKIHTITATRVHQPELKVDRYVWHEWQRAGPGGEEVVVLERTDPLDEEKAIFFWNLNGVILSAPTMLADPASFISRLPSAFQRLGLDFWITLNLFVIFHYLDNVPVFANAPRWTNNSHQVVRKLLLVMDWAISHLVLYFASCLGWAFGILPVQRQHTPPSSYALWWARRKQGKKEI